MTDILKRCIDKAGGITMLAKKLNIAHTTLYSWTDIPSARIIDMERITGIPRQELRPDLYEGMKKVGT